MLKKAGKKSAALHENSYNFEASTPTFLYFFTFPSKSVKKKQTSAIEKAFLGI